MLRKLMLAVFVLSSLLVALPVAAQDGDSQTYVTQEGLVFEYPADWFAADFGGFLIISNDETALGTVEPTEPDSFVFTGFVGGAADVAATLEEEFTTTEELTDLLVASLEESGGTLLERSTTELGDKTVFVIVAEIEGETNLVYVFEVDDLFVFGIGAAASVEVFDAIRPDLDTIVASMYVDANAEPTNADIDFSGETVETVFPQLGEDAFVFYTPISEGNAEGIVASSVDQAVQLSDSTMLVAASGTLYELDTQTGTLSNPVQDSQYLFLNNLVAAPDGTLWGNTYSYGVVNVDRNFNIINSSGPEVFGEGYVSSLAVDDAGTVYAFASIFDEEFNSTGTVYVFDSTGALQSTFVTNGEPDEFGFVPFSSSVAILTMADGNIMLVDTFLATKIVDSQGNLVGEGPQYVAEFEYVSVADLALASDGSLYVFTYDGTIRKYGPNGEPIAEVGRPQAEEDTSAPFEQGELPYYGNMVLLDDNRVLFVGTNFTHSVITLIDFSVAPIPAE